MLGEAIIEDVNHFTATILLQTRVPLGQQTQSLFRFTAERKVPLIPADINGDGAVDFADLLLVITAWGPCPDCPEDIDGDGVVGFADLLEVLSNWS